MEVLAFAEFIFNILLKYGIPGVQKVMEIWKTDEPTLEQIQALKNMKKPEEFFA